VYDLKSYKKRGRYIMCKDAVVFHNKPKGVTLNADESYYICQCGKSKEGVFCDGSHEDTKCPTTCLPKKVVVEKTKSYHICMCKASKNMPFCDGTHSYYTEDDIGKKVN
jgi:CDGSH-type Zn-finger protein